MANLCLVSADSFRANLCLRLELINVELVIHCGALEHVDSVDYLDHFLVSLGHVIVNLGLCVVHVALIALEDFVDLGAERLILSLVDIELAHLILHIENRNA